MPALEARGHEVWTADLFHRPEPRYIRCDIGEYRQVERMMATAACEYIFNLAGEFGRYNGEDYYENLWRTNAVGVKNLLRLQARLRFRLVHASSSEVYGDYDGVMTESVMDQVEVRQMNDYAITKWVNELQILNAAAVDATETVRVRLFNTYGPGERYSPYRSVICRFVYSALHDLPYTVYLHHHRTSTYVDDCAAMLANIVDRFRPGRVYNIAGADHHDIRTCSDLILRHLHKSDALVTYCDRTEPFTTRDKKADGTLAWRELEHRPEVSLEEGIGRTIDWMRREYGR